MRRALIGLILLLFFHSFAVAEIKSLQVGISIGYPPFYFFDENQQPTGICIDVLEHVAEEMNISIRYDSYPWKRMLSYGEEGKVDAVMPLFKTADREQYLFFPDTGLIDEDNSFFVSHTSVVEYSGDLTDVIDRKIGVIEKYSYGQEFDRTEFRNKVPVKTFEQLIPLVVKKRVELAIGNSRVVNYAAQKMGIADDIRFLSPPVTVSPLFIGFSKKNISEDFVDRFNAHLVQLKNSPEYIQIIRKYGF